MSRDHANLRSHFDDLITNSSGGLLDLLQLNEVSLALRESRFLKDVCNYSVAKLLDATESVRSELSSLSTSCKAEFLIEDRNVISSSVDSINSIIKRDVAHLEDLVNALDISRRCDFDDFRAEKQSIMFLLSQYSLIMDLLDIPQLMEACVRNGHYSEALSLHAFVANRAHSYPDGIYGKFLVHQVNHVRSNIVKSVCDSLSGKNLTPEESQTLLIVYRLLFPKTENLNRVFLEFRIQFFNSLKGPKLDGKKFANLIERHLPAIIEQYTSLFGSCDDQFVLHQLDLFLDASYLDNMDTVDSFSACVSMGTAMEKYGFPLTPLIVWKMSKFFLLKIAKKLNDAESGFKTDLAKYDWVPFTSLIDTLSLTRHRPIAIFFNQLVAVLNQVRLFPLLAIQAELRVKINEVLSNALTLVLSLNETPESKIMAENFSTILVPTVEGFLNSIYPK